MNNPAPDDLSSLIMAMEVPDYRTVCAAADGFAGLLKITQAVATIMFLWAVYDRYARHLTTGENPNYLSIVGRLAVVFAGVGLFGRAFDEFVALCDSIGSNLQGPRFLERVARMFMDAEVQLVVKSARSLDMPGMLDVLGSIVAMPVNAVIGQCLAFVTQGVFYAIRFLRNVYLVALRATGPLFIGFYVNEKTRRLAVGWAEHVINVASWPVWMGLLVRIQLAFVEARIGAVSTGIGAAADTLGPRWFVFQSIVLVMLILMIPTVMNRVVRGIGLFR